MTTIRKRIATIAAATALALGLAAPPAQAGREGRDGFFIGFYSSSGPVIHVTPSRPHYGGYHQGYHHGYQHGYNDGYNDGYSHHGWHGGHYAYHRPQHYYRPQQHHHHHHHHYYRGKGGARVKMPE